MHTVSLHVRHRATEVSTCGAASSWHIVHGTCKMNVRCMMRDEGHCERIQRMSR